MAFPKLDTPIYDVKLISTGKKIRIRPFLIKEQKLFLMASESNDEGEILKTVKQVLKNCILDDINIDELPIFDIEFLFLNLRARSVDEIVELKYKCNNKKIKEDGNTSTCGNLVEFSVNLLEITPTLNEKHTTKIELTENVGIMMKYPTFNIIEKYESVNNNPELIVEIISECIDYVYDKDNIHYAKDQTKEEILEFIDNLQQKDLEKIKLFFDTIPELKKVLKFKCEKCGYEEDITVKGIQSFFV